MLGQQARMKRRAAVIAVLALLSFLACLAAAPLAAWIRFRLAMCHTPWEGLEPLAMRLRQSVLPDATGPFISERLRSKVADHAAILALQQELERTVPIRPDILAAAIVSPDGRIVAAYPGRERLVGRSLRSNRLAFAAPGGPGTAVPFPIPSDAPSRLRALLGQVLLGGWPEDLHILDSQWLFVLPNEGGYELTVLPRPMQPAYGLSAHYLGPASRIGAVLSFAVYWLMLPWWVFLDARWRTGKAMPLVLFVLLTNFLGWLTYLVIRPEGNQMCPVCVNLALIAVAGAADMAVGAIAAPGWVRLAVACWAVVAALLVSLVLVNHTHRTASEGEP